MVSPGMIEMLARERQAEMLRRADEKARRARLLRRA